jgi:hypothetical protein
MVYGQSIKVNKDKASIWKVQTKNDIYEFPQPPKEGPMQDAFLNIQEEYGEELNYMTFNSDQDEDSKTVM